MVGGGDGFIIFVLNSNLKTDADCGCVEWSEIGKRAAGVATNVLGGWVMGYCCGLEGGLFGLVL